MALSKATGFLVVLLVIYHTLQNQGYRESLSLFFKELAGTKALHREKREASSNSFESIFQVVINTSDLESLQTLLSNLRLPQQINGTSEITSINATTVCSPSGAEYQCRCKESYAWSNTNCLNHNACDDFVGDRCGCISALPADDQYCQPLASRADPVDMYITLELRIPVSSVASNFIQRFRDNVTRLSLPHITQSLKVIGLNFTTGCFLNSSGGRQCECEKQFAWSCDKCRIYGACSNTANQTCGCINGLPSDGEFCEPITNVTQCSAPRVNETTPATAVTNLSFAMDMPFNPSYNDRTNSVYQNVFKSIEKQSAKYISTVQPIQTITFRNGSTVCDYTLTATSIQESEILDVKVGIFNELAETYKMFFDSATNLVFDQPEVFLEEKVIVTCGPPPVNLNFSNNYTAVWKRNDEVIREDEQHKFSNGGETEGATLTVLKFFATDDGTYECTLRRGDQSAFRQRSKGEYKHIQRPLIKVSPTRITVQCPGKQQLNCSVNSPYEVQFKGKNTEGTNDITYEFPLSDCTNEREENITCQVKKYTNIHKNITLMLSSKGEFHCKNDLYGVGNETDTVEAPCEENEVGEKTIVCGKDGSWRLKRDNCVLVLLQQLLDQTEFLNNNSLPIFLKQLSEVNLNSTEDVVSSPANINANIDILNSVANLNISITSTSMKDILLTAGILTTNESKNSWNILNTKRTRNISGPGPVSRRKPRPNLSNSTGGRSSTFLLSLETLTGKLTNDDFDIDTPFILLNKTKFTDNFNAEFNSSVEINVTNGMPEFITVITFASMDNVLPVRAEDNVTNNSINGRVVLVQSSDQFDSIDKVSLTFDVVNETLEDPKCVFWNFSLLGGIGGWDGTGCELGRISNKTVTCNCDHLTSFSILMSPSVPHGLSTFLEFITYIGVGISMASLVICLIIEALIWRKIRRNDISYLRHVTIVNIAVSLLIANVWFIIGAFISNASEKDKPACTTATFFIHCFYLALFFWMLASGLLLLYHTVNVFNSGLSQKTMLAIGFTLGYGAPLVIAVITIAVTEPKDEYIRQTGCWLNWDPSKALLAFVVPALLIVVINLVILLVVIYKILRRRVGGDAAQAAERHVLVVIIRSLAVLTPFFGLTWSLGVGTMVEPDNRGIHVSFAFFNSLQGFFILVFGTLLDKKVRSEIAMMSQSYRTETRSTNVGTSSSGGFFFFRNWRREVYNVSSGESGSPQPFIST